MTFETSKNLGGLGALLLVVAAVMVIFLPVATFIVGAAGAIMLLIGLHGLAGYYKERGIFNYGLISFLVVVIGGIIAAVVFLFVVLANIAPLLHEIYPTWNGDWASLQNLPPPDTNALQSGNFDISALMPMLVGMVAVFVLVWIVAIIAGVFIRQSLNQIKDKSNVNMFGTAGIIVLIGAFLGIIFIGYIIMVIGILLAAIAFFQLRPTPPTVEPTVYAPPPTVPPAI
jgi:uncharacterized membrane protein